MENISYDLGIIGGGPAGYSAAIRASQKGLSVVLFEKDCMGGVCLNRGCIPTKAVLHCTDFYKSLKKAEKFGVSIPEKSVDYEKIFNRKNELVTKIQKSLTKLVQSHGVTIITAEAVIRNNETIEADGQNYKCRNIILAAGSKPAKIKGLVCDGEFILNSNQLLECKNLPDNILIAGSGAIGIEWARIFSGLEKTVTVIELAPNLLPSADIEVSKRLERLFKKDKIKFFTNTKIGKIENKTVTLNNGQVLSPDMILCAIGREPVIPKTEGIEIEQDGKFVKVNENFQTNHKNIFAVGDINGRLQLAHSAVHQAIGVVDFITDGKKIHFDAEKIPSVIYGSPEIAWVGKTEQSMNRHSELDSESPAEPVKNYSTSCFPIAALGKAQADDEIDGFIKIIEQNGKIIGAHVVAPEASSMIQQMALVIDNELTKEDVLKTVFAHPTYSEGVFEAVLGLDNMSLSLPKGI